MLTNEQQVRIKTPDLNSTMSKDIKQQKEIKQQAGMQENSKLSDASAFDTKKKTKDNDSDSCQFDWIY